MYKYNKSTSAEAKKIIKELARYGKEFYKGCLECSNSCLMDPMKNVSFKQLIDNGFNISELSQILQKGTSMNFFCIKFINGFAL